jgi:hypothetical protein
MFAAFILATCSTLVDSTCSSQTHLLDESCLWFDEASRGAGTKLGSTKALVLPDRGQFAEVTVEWWLLWLKEISPHNRDQTVLTDSLCVGDVKSQVEGLDCEPKANNLRLFLNSKLPGVNLVLDKNKPQNATFELPDWTPEQTAPQQTHWTHYALAYSTKNARAELYINGELQPGGHFDHALPMTLGPALIGDWLATDQGLSGCLRELRFWKKQLNAEEIKNAMTCTANSSETLIAAYPFKHDLEDASGNGLHATGTPKFASPLDLWHTTQMLEALPSSSAPPASAGADCTIDGWTEWTACSKSCDGGFQVKEPLVRTYPMQGGAPCPPMRMRVCSTADCDALESQLAAYSTILKGKDRDVRVIMWASGLLLAVAAGIITLYRTKAVALAKEIDTTHELQFEMANSKSGTTESPMHAQGLDNDDDDDASF